MSRPGTSTITRAVYHEPAAAPDFLAEGGEMGALMRAHDWTSTAVGPPEQWPQSLRTALSILLNSKYPMFIGWGLELEFFYNDAYRPILGANKHPRALGAPMREIWAEIWDVLGPLADRAVNRAEPTWSDDQLLIMNRFGYPEETYFTFSYSPIRDESGGIGGMFCACTETTERVLGERRLRTLSELGARAHDVRSVSEACDRAAAILEQNGTDTPFALIYLLDPDGATARLAASAGIERPHPAAPDTIDLRGATPAAWPLRIVAETGRAEVLELAALAPLSGGRWPEQSESAIVLPLVAPSLERPAGFLVSGINPRRRLDPAYGSFLNLAASHVATAVSNARAYEEERRRAEALAELDRAKTLFFSNVSHEFRTPLTLMLGPLEDALHSAQLPPRERERLDVAHRNGMRLLRLVNTLLDFSRVEAGRAQASFEPTDLAALTVDLASNFRSACERAGLSLLVYCPPLPEPVYVDREMWEKIVLNLLSNAFKFTLQGRIEVKLQARDQAVELVVRDTGVGIPPGDLGRVFDRFHRVEGQHGRSHEGTGIGLTLVQELVRLHGGAVRVESTVGAGTVFTVEIPRGTAHLASERIGADRQLVSTRTRATAFVEEALRWLPADAGDANAPASQIDAGWPDAALEAVTVGASHRHRERVLLAEDNADMRDYVSRLLAPAWEIEAVGDGEAALEAARRRRPDLVLSDVMMPRLDGFGLLQELRSDPELRTVPVVLLSARAGEEAQVEGLDAGADDYLVKPFSARELVARVRGILDLARMRREAEAALREREAEFKEAQRLGHIGSWRWDASTDATTGSEELLRIYGLDTTKPIPEFRQQRGTLYPVESWERINAAVQEALVTGVGYELDVKAFRGGAPIWITTRSAPVRDASGRIVGLRGTVQDITERKQADDHMRLIMGEMSHRSKNLLAVVQAMVRQTARHADNIEAFQEGLGDRISALAGAHDLLVSENWEGAPVRELIERQLQPFVDALNERVVLEGPDVTISAQAAQSLALAMHELATNASKYGALSGEQGRVAVTWNVEPMPDGRRRFSMRWQERGGPPVQAPVRRGFGSFVLERMVGAGLNGESRLDYAPDGLNWTLASGDAPFARLRRP